MAQMAEGTGGAAPAYYSAEIIRGSLRLTTSYEVSVCLPTGQRSLTKKYKDFERLRDKLTENGLTLPALPPSAGWSLLRSSFRDERQDQLSVLLAAAIAANPSLQNDALADFLEASQEDRIALRNATSAAAAAPEPAISVPIVTDRVGLDKPTAVAAPAVTAGGGLPEAPTTQENPNDALGAVRSLRRQQWERQRQQQESAPSASAAGSSPVSPQLAAALAATAAQSGRANATDAQLPPPAIESTALEPRLASGQALEKLHIVPLEAKDEVDADRMAVIRGPLEKLRRAGTELDRGYLIDTDCGVRFIVVTCVPERGSLTTNTLYFLDGPPPPKLRRVQFIALKHREPSDTDEAMVQNHLAPHFRRYFADQRRCAFVAEGETPSYGGVHFHVRALDPAQKGCGIVDEDTEVFANLDAVNEFHRIHCVPFSDTLPSAYQFNLFADYVSPFFSGHLARSFVLGEICVFNGVMFKIVAAEPQGPCRVGSHTEIFTEGQLHPTAQDLLSPEQSRLLSVFPPGIQMLLLQTDTFGNGEVAERLHAAEAARVRAARRPGVTASIASSTEEHVWTDQLRERLQLDQDQCIVCLQDFMPDERVRLLPCRHVFHTNCIDEWLGRDTHCPLCRHGLRSGSRGGRNERRIGR